MDEVCNILKKSVERYGKPSPAFGEQEKIANQPAMCSKDSNGNGLTVKDYRSILIELAFKTVPLFWFKIIFKN